MPGETRTLSEVIRKAIAGATQDMHVALPGRVERYDFTTNLADVTVMVQHPVLDDDNRLTYEDLGILNGVPVCFMRAGGFMFTLPLSQSDQGLLLFHSTAIGEWRSTGQKSQPQDTSRHSIGWPVFMPMLFPDTNALPNVTERQAGPVLGKEGTNNQIRFGSDSIEVYHGGNAAARKADPVNAGYLVVSSTGTLVSYFAGDVPPSTANFNAATTAANNISGSVISLTGGVITNGSGKVTIGG